MHFIMNRFRLLYTKVNTLKVNISNIGFNRRYKQILILVNKYMINREWIKNRSNFQIYPSILTMNELLDMQ